MPTSQPPAQTQSHPKSGAKREAAQRGGRTRPPTATAAALDTHMTRNRRCPSGGSVTMSFIPHPPLRPDGPSAAGGDRVADRVTEGVTQPRHRQVTTPP